jgi:two-component system cell cycle sensor histidine kinase/response regulator CckA
MASVAPLPVDPSCTGTVLLVEDEAPVRATTRRMLERCGFVVVEARHGRDALALWDEHAAELTALVTDVRMPEMGGRELAVHLRARRPSLPIVFISGYADQASLTPRDALERVVEKPFTSRALVGALREVLGK